MKSKFPVFVVAVISLCFLSGKKIPEPAAPYGLMVDFIRETHGTAICDLKPELTWIVPAECKSQTAFQVLISSSSEYLDAGKGDVWDSGKVTSSNSVENETAVSLEANTQYFWKVRIWDHKERVTGYSLPQPFKTGSPHGYQATPSPMVWEEIEPERIVRIAGKHYLLDFGKDAFGTLLFNINVSEKDTLIIHLGEKINNEGKIDRSPGGSIRYQRVLLPISPSKKNYIADLPPDKRNTGPAAIKLPDSAGVVTPFRYAEIENFPYQPAGGEIIQRALFSFFDNTTSSFISSDTVLNAIWDICKYSMKATSFAGIYVDGDRERIPYEADAYINQLGHYYTDREYAMARVTSEYFIEHPTWPTEWILHTVLMFYNDIMFTGNTESASQFYDKLKHKTLVSLAGDDGLISAGNVNDDIMASLGFSNPKERIRDNVDWPPAQKDTGWKLAGPDGERDGYEMVEVNTVVNAFYYRNLVLMSGIATILGKDDDARFYSALAGKVRNLFNEKLLNKTTGIYVDGINSTHSSLHANMMALAFDLVPQENLKNVIEFIKSRGMACSVYGAQYLLEGLYRHGEAGYALSLMNATHDRSWWNMIKSGSTITMEAWDMKYKPNSDWNHAWGAAPASIIPGFMWGITPATPGFGRVTIKPQLGNLNYSKIKVPTIRGTITAEYKKQGKAKQFTITIPGNMECDFFAPDKMVYRLAAGVNKVKI